MLRSSRRWPCWLLVACYACHGHCGSGGSPSGEWRPVADGLDYRYFKSNGTQLHAVRIDVAKLDLRVARKDTFWRAATTAEFATRTNALVAINGSFFDERTNPLGWIVSNGATLNPQHDTDWFAALLIRELADRRWAEVRRNDDLKAMSSEELRTVKFALQVGPRTVADSAPVKLKNQRAARSAACVTESGEVVLLSTRGAEAEANWLAALMARPVSDGGFGCRDGLLFDGGPSSQLSIHTPALTLDLPGGTPVPDAVVVVPRSVR